MITPQHLGALALVIAGALWARSSGAQVSSDAAKAEALSSEGRQLLEQGNWKDGCVKLRAALDLDPTVRTLFNLGSCSDYDGKLLLARERYSQAEVMNAGDPDPVQKAQRATMIRDALRDLDARIPKLRIQVLPPAVDARVVVDGKELVPEERDRPVLVEAGEHRIEVTAKGYRPVSTTETVDVDNAAKPKEVVLTLVEEPPSAAPPTSAPEPAPVAPAPNRRADGGSTDPDSETSDVGRGQRIGGAIVGGAGALGLVGAALFGVQFLSKRSDILDECDSNNVCTPKALTLRDEAADARTTAYVLLGVGAAATIGGVVLYATAPDSPGPGATVTASIGLGGGMISGVW